MFHSANEQPPDGARVAVYYRCSSDMQEHSIPDQKTVVDEQAARRQWRVVEEYADQGESGATIDNRPGLLRLLAAAASGRFDYVVVYDLSRVTRGGVGEFWTPARFRVI